MKDYKMTIKIVSEKEVLSHANSAKEAAEMGVELCSDLSKLKLSDKDIVSVEGCVLDDEQEQNCSENCKGCSGYCCRIEQCIECEDCKFICDFCNCCILNEEEHDTSEDCEGCRFYCEECGACTYDEDFEDEYVDDEFELRKQIFKDYISDKIDEVIEYGKDLFEVE